MKMKNDVNVSGEKMSADSAIRSAGNGNVMVKMTGTVLKRPVIAGYYQKSVAEDSAETFMALTITDDNSAEACNDVPGVSIATMLNDLGKIISLDPESLNTFMKTIGLDNVTCYLDELRCIKSIKPTQKQEILSDGDDETDYAIGVRLTDNEFNNPIFTVNEMAFAFWNTTNAKSLEKLGIDEINDLISEYEKE